MASRIRVEINHAALGQLLKSPQVAALVEAEAERIKTNAESRDVQVDRGTDRAPMPYEIQVGIVGDRVGALVIAAHPAGLAAEAKYGTLAGAVD